jgi:hypothetical protein
VAEDESGDPHTLVQPEGLVARPLIPLVDQYGKRVMVKLKVSDLASLTCAGAT